MPDTEFDLSFVKRLPRGERMPDGMVFCFWSVEPSGDYEADLTTGRGLAQEYLCFCVDAAKRGDFGLPLSQIVRHMPHEHTGVEIGFLSDVGTAATGGLPYLHRVIEYQQRCADERQRERSERARHAAKCRWAKQLNEAA